MELNFIIQSIEPFQHASIINVFKSKKNVVSLIRLKQSYFVLKVYSKNNINGFYNEINILSTSKNNYDKPRIISSNEIDRYILLEYIKGDNVCDVINDSNVSIEKKIEIVIDLARWFDRFHRDYLKNDRYMIHGDAILRNFLFNTKVIGLDFEEVSTGKPIQDIAQICVSILTTDPQFTKEKKELMEMFIQTYQKESGQTLPLIQDEIQQAIQDTKERRNKWIKKD